MKDVHLTDRVSPIALSLEDRLVYPCLESSRGARNEVVTMLHCCYKMPFRCLKAQILCVT